MLCTAIFCPAVWEPGLVPMVCGVRINFSGSTWRSGLLIGVGSSRKDIERRPGDDLIIQGLN